MYFFTGVLEKRRAQWQAQEPPQDVALLLAVDDALSLLPAAAAGAGDSAGLLPVLLLAELPLRKSVAYQPEPLSWKPAAVSCFLNASALQDGQEVSTGSEIFCSTSCAWPQDSQRYA
jgi:hypothetical protein